MGHSEAIRKVKNVFDGVEFTIPNRQTMKLARHGKLLGTENYHSRECFVVAEKKYHRQIASDIKNIPEYFKGQPTTINFVTENQLLKLKSKMYHRGEIISKFKTIHGSNCLVDFKLKMDSNPNFTATVMSRYINAILNLKNKNQAGAFTCLDIPPIYLFDEEKRLYYTDKLC